jgi:Fe-S-cluster containining protein
VLDDDHEQVIQSAALAALIDQRLGAKPLRGASAKILRLLNAIQDRTNSTSAQLMPVACRKGCALCCNIFVSASAPEIFAIADYVRANAQDLEAEIGRFRAAEAKTRGLDVKTRMDGEHVVCPLLVDSICSVYDARPSACRAFFSLSLSDCQRAEAGEDVEIRKPAMPIRGRAAVVQGLWTVLYARRLPNRNYELGHALAIALENPAAEEQWYAGVEVFSAVAIDRDGENLMPPGMAEALWSFIWAISQGEVPARGQFEHAVPKWCMV